MVTGVLAAEGDIDSDLGESLACLGTVCGANLLVATVRVTAHLLTSVTVRVPPS